MNFDYCEGKIHVIKAGDTLYSISRMHRVPLAMILRANPYVDVYNLQVGDEICVPVPVTAPEPIPQPLPTPERPPEGGMAVLEYLTVEGDDIQKVLNEFQISLEDLLKFNDLMDMKLVPGIRLKIPQTPENNRNCCR
ncbi:MAG: LysM peptidoglycan-binding domain-containing protein [Acetivibrio ethanolgignens]